MKTVNMPKLQKTYSSFAYDGCHKIYLISTPEQAENATSIGYNIKPLQSLKETYENSCSLRFISDWDLTKMFVAQFEKAKFVI